MAKSKTFKRIAALATAIALVVCFAVSASAVTVTTTTQYVTGDKTKVNVTVDVTNATGADYVTYYATKDGVVYVDQVAVDGDGKAQIKYQTDADNLKGTVKVGYTGGEKAEDATIDARTVTCDGVEVKLLPTEAETASFTFKYEPGENQTVKNVTAVGATVTAYEYISDKNEISVSLASFTGDVTLTVEKEATETYDATIQFIDAAARLVAVDNEGEVDANKANKNDRKITIIGKATNATEYGVVVSEEPLESSDNANKTALEETGATFYKALDSRQSGEHVGLFAVQIIDQATEEASKTIKAGENYYVAIYVIDAGECHIVASTSAINTNKQ